MIKTKKKRKSQSYLIATLFLLLLTINQVESQSTIGTQDCKYGTYAVKTSNGSSTCIKCPTGCDLCSSAQVCSKCSVGFKQIGTTCVSEVCLKADPYCLKCDTTESSCMVCQKGFMKGPNQKYCAKQTDDTKKCPQEQCSECDAAGVCKGCYPGYQLRAGVCHSTNSAGIPGCQKLGESTTGKICQQCSPGYTMADKTKTACTLLTKMPKLKPGYGYDTLNGDMIPCLTKDCDTCLNYLKCDSCSEGLNLRYNKCEEKPDSPCSPECLQCDKVASTDSEKVYYKCSFCKLGFRALPFTPRCEREIKTRKYDRTSEYCSENLENCSKCYFQVKEGFRGTTAMLTCEVCKSGYSLLRKGKRCIKSDPSMGCDAFKEELCDSCKFDSAGVARCEKCYKGFTLNQKTGKCESFDQKCGEYVKNCNHCSSSDGQLTVITCKQCKFGYTFDKSQNACVEKKSDFDCSKIHSTCKRCGLEKKEDEENIKPVGGTTTYPVSQKMVCYECSEKFIPTYNWESCSLPITQCTIKGCSKCTFELTGKETCISCSPKFELSKTTGYCTEKKVDPEAPKCSDIRGCTKCGTLESILVTGQKPELFCLACLKGFAPSKDGKSCEAQDEPPFIRGENIPNCQKWVPTDFDIRGMPLKNVCVKCSSGKLPSLDGTKCIDSKFDGQIQYLCKEIKYGKFCTIIMDKPRAIVCYPGYRPSQDGTTCQVYNTLGSNPCSKIEGCLGCRSFNDNKITFCTYCDEGLAPTKNSLKCEKKPDFKAMCQKMHPGCGECTGFENFNPDNKARLPQSISQGPRCIKCAAGFKFDSARKCQKIPDEEASRCKKMFPNCDECYGLDSTNSEAGGTILQTLRKGPGCARCAKEYQLTISQKCVHDEILKKRCKMAFKNCATCENMENYIPPQNTDSLSGSNRIPKIFSKPACKECMSGFSKNKEGECIKESETKKCDVIDNCAECGTPAPKPGFDVIQVIQCFRCDQGYTLSGNNMKCYNNKDVLNCKKKFPGCLKCSTPPSDSNTVADVEPFCEDCGSGLEFNSKFGRCMKKCKEGYFNHCSECWEIVSSGGKRTPKCFACDAGFKPTSDNQKCKWVCKKTPFCDECEYKVNTRNEFQEFACYKCKPGYKKDSKNQCIPIPDPKECDIEGCKTCRYLNGEAYCSQCKDEFQQTVTRPAKCVERSLCQENIPGCTRCKFYSEEKMICSGCENALELDIKTNTCNPKDGNGDCKLQNCELCKMHGTRKVCEQCYLGFSPNKNGICEKKKCEFENCSKCQINPVGQYDCSACNSGFFLNDEGECQSIEKSKCSEVLEGCEKCSFLPFGAFCTKCKSGFERTVERRCKEEGKSDCSTRDPQCLECDDLSTSSSTRKISFCRKCIEGFYPNKDGKCEEEKKEEKCKKDEYCLECGEDEDGDFKCTKCRPGFSVNGMNKCEENRSTSNCFKKIYGCAECSTINSFVGTSVQPRCNRCAFGFSLNNGKCIKIQEKCLNNLNGCIRCSLSETDNDTVKCSACLFGFGINSKGICERNDKSKSCSEIDPYCSSCKKDTTGKPVVCGSCLENYTWNEETGSCEYNNVSCYLKNRGCFTCGETSGKFKCFECNGEFMLTEEGLCKSRSNDKCLSSDPGCSLATNLDGKCWCKDCRDGYDRSTTGRCIKDYKNKCSEKIENCLLCSEDKAGNPVCKYCKGKDLKVKDGKCVKLSMCEKALPNCDKCDFFENGESECLSCLNNYKVSPIRKTCMHPLAMNCRDFVSGCVQCSGLKELKENYIKFAQSQNKNDGSKPAEITEIMPKEGIKCTKCQTFMEPSEDGKTCGRAKEMRCDMFFPGCSKCLNLDFYKTIYEKKFSATIEISKDSVEKTNSDSAIGVTSKPATNQYPRCTACQEGYYTLKRNSMYLECLSKEKINYCQKTMGLSGCLLCSGNDTPSIMPFISGSSAATAKIAAPRCYLCESGLQVSGGKCIKKRIPATNCNEVIPGCNICYKDDKEGEIKKCDKCYFRHTLTKEGKCEYDAPKCSDYLPNCGECQNLPDYLDMIKKIEDMKKNPETNRIASSDSDLSMSKRPVCTSCLEGYEKQESSNGVVRCIPKKVIPKDKCSEMFKGCLECGTPQPTDGSFVAQVIQCLKCPENAFLSPNRRFCIMEDEVDMRCGQFFKNCLKCGVPEVPGLSSLNTLSKNEAPQTKVLKCLECNEGYFSDEEKCRSEDQGDDDEEEEDDKEKMMKCSRLIPGCVKCTIPEVPQIPTTKPGEPEIAICLAPPTCDDCGKGFIKGDGGFLCEPEESTISRAIETEKTLAGTASVGNKPSSNSNQIDCPDTMQRCSNCKKVISFMEGSEESIRRLVCDSCPEGFKVSDDKSGCVKEKTDPGCSIDKCQTCGSLNYFIAGKAPEKICSECFPGYAPKCFNQGVCEKINESEEFRKKQTELCGKKITNCIECCESERTGTGNIKWTIIDRKCTLCAKGFTPSANKRRCIKEESTLCEPGQYLRNGKCLTCNKKKCFTCKGSANKCTGCNPGFKLNEKTGVCSRGCKNGEYFNKKEKECKLCATGCSKCKAEDSCFKCEMNYSIKKGIVEKCDIENGFYYIKTNQKCRQCHKSCQTCKNRSKCVDCKKGLVKLDNGLCGVKKVVASKTECGEKEYFHSRSKQCLPCHASCESCKGRGPRKCSSCDKSKGLNLLGGRCGCKLGSFLNGDGECQSCHDPVGCGKCFGAGKNQCYRCRHKGYIKKKRRCINCAETPDGADAEILELYKEFCEEDVSEIEIGDEEGIPIVEDDPNEKEEVDFGKPKERRIASNTYNIKLGDPKNFGDDVFKGKDEQKMFKRLMKIKIEGYVEGKDFEVKFFRSKTRPGYVDFDVNCKKDIDSEITIAVDDPGACRKDPVFDALMDDYEKENLEVGEGGDTIVEEEGDATAGEEDPTAEEGGDTAVEGGDAAGEDEDIEDSNEPDQATLDLLAGAGFDVNELVTGLPESEIEQYDGSTLEIAEISGEGGEEVGDGDTGDGDSLEDPQANAPNRVLQTEGGTDTSEKTNTSNEPSGPIIKKTSITKKFSGRKVPTNDALNFAENFGQFFNIFMISLFVLGIILSFLKLKFDVNFDGYFLQLLVLIEFLGRTALIDVNYGYLLSTFFDQVYKFDSGMMMNLIDEKKLRGDLKGKLNYYSVPIMVLNSIPLPLTVYLITSIVALIVNKVSKSATTKKIISSIQFVITSITILDIVFYSSVQLGQHNLGNSENTFGNYISMAISIIGTFFIIFEFIRLIYYSFSKSSFKKDQETEEVLEHNIFIRFSSLGWKTEGVEKSSIIRSLNAFYVLRFALTQVVIASFQSSPGVTCWALILLNTGYVIHLVVALCMYRKFISSKFEFIQKVFLEACLLLFMVMVLLFEADPTNNKYSSDQTENMQKFMMVMLLVMVISQVVAFVIGVLREFKEKKTKDIGVVKDIKSAKSSHEALPNANDSIDISNPVIRNNENKKRKGRKGRRKSKQERPGMMSLDNSAMQIQVKPRGTDDMKGIGAMNEAGGQL